MAARATPDKQEHDPSRYQGRLDFCDPDRRLELCHRCRGGPTRLRQRKTQPVPATVTWQETQLPRNKGKSRCDMRG